MNKEAKIYVAGHTGLVGSALMNELTNQKYTNIITKTAQELDLRNQGAVNNFFEKEQPDFVFLAAAKVGGIHANNTLRAEFMYDNLMIEAHIIHAAHIHQVQKLLFLGSSCIYPRMCPQPIKEEYLLTGPLEPTNEPYALAKIAGIKLCESYRHQYGSNFISCMPTNLYGPRDNFDLQSSHVLPALIAKIHNAHINNEASVSVWGTGKPRREFLFIEDLAQALIFLMNNYNDATPINVGTGNDCSISELAHEIQCAIGYQGALTFDSTKPDGTPRKLLNVERINNLGWSATTKLSQGIRKTIEWYIHHYQPLTISRKTHEKPL
jgi:GDP-L-fucose synthase